MKPKYSKLKFENLFKISSFGLWMNGSCPTLPRGWRFRSLGALTVIVTCFYLLCYSLIYHRIPNSEYGDVARESIMTILAFTLVCKYTIVLRNRYIILNIIRYIECNLESEDYSAVEKEILWTYTNKGLFVTRFWLFITALSGFLFICKALISTIYSHWKGDNKFVQIFELVYPSFLESHKNEFPAYVGINTLLASFDFYAVMGYIGFEPLLAIFLLHFCGQLEILSTRMRNIFKQSNKTEEILINIKRINIELKTIYKLADNVQNTFVALFEFTMKTTIFMLPFTVFQITQDLRRDVINIEFLSLLSAVLLQFYMPCYYSNFLMEKSEYMRQAIYSCGWEDHPNKRIRNTVIFMLTRTNKPVVLRTIFYPLSLETFAEMCRQAYAIYNIISAVWR